MNPTVSVVLPVFNCERYIHEAIESVLGQTYGDFELIVIDDKSTDNTVEIIKSFDDSRIKLHLNKENIGRAASDNFAISLIKGKYIAKMDGDDICHPDRFKKQVEYFNKNQQVNVVGSWIKSFGVSNYLHKYPSNSIDVKCKTVLGMPVGNSSIMFRSDLFLEKGFRYDESLLHLGEDYEFFARYMKDLCIHVIQEPLLYYRTYPNGFKNQIIKARKLAVKAIRRNFLEEWNMPLSEDEFDLLDLIYNLDEPLIGFGLVDVERLLNKIIKHNKTTKLFSPLALRNFLALRWFYVCYHFQQQRLGSTMLYWRSGLSKCDSISLKLKLKLFYKGLSNI